MESTSVFERGLKLAYEQKAKEGTLENDDTQVIGALVDPAKSGVLDDIQRRSAMRRLHRRVRREYVRQHGGILPEYINWEAIVGWIKENWELILRIALTILPFLIL